MRNTSHLIFVLLFIANVVSAQWRPQPFYYEYLGIKAPNVMIAPRDTVQANVGSEPDSARIAYKNGRLWVHDKTGFRDIANIKDLWSVNITWYGAIPNDAINDAPAIQAAINTGYPVVIPNGIFTLNSSLTLSAQNRIYGLGETSLLQTTGDFPAIVVDGNDVQIQDIGFIGSGRGTVTNYATTRPNNHGVYIDGTFVSRVYTTIRNCFFDGFGGAAVYTRAANNITHKPGIIMSDCTLGNSYVGLWCDTLSEYSSFANCVFNLNQYGVRLSGGNNNIVGGQITDNRTGVYLTGGGNEAHSVVSGTAINHNYDKSVHANGVRYGHLFSGCMLYYGDILLEDSKKIKFADCDFHTPNFLADNSDTCEVINGKWLITPTFNLAYNGNASSVFFFNNHWADTPAAGIYSTLRDPLRVSPSLDNNYAVDITNNGTTAASGLKVNAPNGNPFRVDLGANTYILLNGGGRLLIGNSTSDDGTGTLQVGGKVRITGAAGYNQLRLVTPYTPSSTADSNGSVGDVAWDDGFFYIKTSVGWKRSALSTF